MTAHIPDNNNDERFEKIIPKLKIAWQKSSDEVWSEVSNQIQAPELNINSIYRRRWLMYAAAVLFLLIGVSVTMNYYTVSYSSNNEQLANIQLPDNSEVVLDMNGKIKLKPLLWWLNRTVELTGNAYFEVEKGSSFKVVSRNGFTEVLGTSFYVFSNDDTYEVICASGVVKVQASITEHSVILHPNQKASLQDDGQLEIQSDIPTKDLFKPQVETFIFTSTRLDDVFKRVGEYYNCTIYLNEIPEHFYTGSFDSNISIDDALKLICRPFNLSVERKEINTYIISNE